mmetsp:Transcript_120559/g.257454  ORF Transcript_120559/g.257454 Transcript_120559/m.257454 type:complete len:327 (+) Transcript_120559:109-1089(+)
MEKKSEHLVELNNWAQLSALVTKEGLKGRENLSPNDSTDSSPSTSFVSSNGSSETAPFPSPPPGLEMPMAVLPSAAKEYHHKLVPKPLNVEEEYKSMRREGPPTTLMIRNIPNAYSQQDLIAELEDLGFAGTFDFFYMPIDHGRHRHHGTRRSASNVGYAFVNFLEPTMAEKCIAMLQDRHFQRNGKVFNKTAVVSVAHIQGLEANRAHYEHAAVNTANPLKKHPQKHQDTSMAPLIVANISKALPVAEPEAVRRHPEAGERRLQPGAWPDSAAWRPDVAWSHCWESSGPASGEPAKVLGTWPSGDSRWPSAPLSVEAWEPARVEL